MINIRDIMMDKTDEVLVLMEPAFCWEDREKK